MFLFLRSIVAILGVGCGIASARPGPGPGEAVVTDGSGYPALAGTSIPRGLLYIADIEARSLSKRQCRVGDLYCPAVTLCCITGYSCCGFTFCCPPGFVCPVSGPCQPGAV
jgi:hypothetical protein